MMTENYFVTEEGFKRRTKFGGYKCLVNDELGITIQKLGNSTFLHVENNKEFYDITELYRIMCIRSIEMTAERFKAGLPEINLRQGNFDKVYEENKQGDNRDIVFMSHDKAKQLLRAKFNWLISDALMASNSKPNYDYRITRTSYHFRQHEATGRDKIISLNLEYDYKDSMGNHNFTHSFTVYNFRKNDFAVNERMGLYVPIDWIIKLFT